MVLAKEKHGLRERDMAALGARFVPFTAQTRMSGVDVGGSAIRKGAVDAVLAYVGAPVPRRAVGAAQPVVAVPEAVREIQAIAERIGKAGGTPLAVAKDGRLLGVVHLKDIVKGGIRERFAELRRMGIRTVMITGDNPMTAAAIAAEAGRRRLPRRGDAGGQAPADPRRAGQGQARRHVRRRHQRRAGARRRPTSASR